MKELIVEAALDSLDAVIDFIHEELKGYSEKILTQIDIAAEEIFVNIANYAYSEKGSVLIRVTAGDTINIEFEDSGSAYNPLLREDPDMNAPAEEREIGGLGIFMVKQIMDSVEYRREDGKNILTISKKSV